MKTKTTITEINHEDLVNLLCTATYGSDYLDIKIPKGMYVGTDLEDETDCREDKWAKVLLAGKPIYVYDYYAEEVAYGELPHDEHGEDGVVRYKVTLEDIRNGLQKCLDGTFKANDAKEVAYMKKCAVNLMEERSDFDLTEAESLMQVIVFGELIYG